VKVPSGKEQAREEFEKFVGSCAADLLRTGYLVVWDLAAAEDLVQECLFRVARRWHKVRTMEHPTAYARRILINLALDSAARRSRQRSELAHHDRSALQDRLDIGAARQMGLIESRMELAHAVAALPPRQRAALVLRYFEDLSETETAEALGCSVGTVKSTTSRALERVRQVISSAPERADSLVPEHSSIRNGAIRHD
jgi:RNA polymerase sigma-70 factor (sigma-E family)